jgi:nucleotide-binding universal stress UspA family protein
MKHRLKLFHSGEACWHSSWSQRGMQHHYPNVLAAIDFSPCGHAAMAHASRLAGGAPIDVVHVLVAPRELDEKQSAKFRATIEQAVRDSALGIQIRRIFLPTGGIADAILQTAQGAHADVLVVGTHGRRGLEHFLTGSVAEEIVRRAVIPVLVVRATNCGDVTLFDVEQALIDEQDG